MKAELPKPAIAAIVAVVAIVIFLIGNRVVNGPGPVNATNTTEGHNKIVEWANRTHGDYAQLTTEEKRQVDAVSRGNGTKFLANTYKQFQSGQTK